MTAGDLSGSGGRGAAGGAITLRCERVERAFLDAAARSHSGFPWHVAERLAAGEELYGDLWARRGVRELLVELLEEAAEVGAWAVLAVQSLDELPEGRRERIAALLALAAGHGACAHEALSAAAAALDAAEGGSC